MPHRRLLRSRDVHRQAPGQTLAPAGGELTGQSVPGTRSVSVVRKTKRKHVERQGSAGKKKKLLPATRL